MSETSLQRNSEVEWARRKELVLSSKAGPEQKELYLKYLDHIAEGGRTKDFLQSVDATWSHLARVYAGRSEIYQLLEDAKRRGEVIRQLMREDEADRRAMDGVEEPVYQGGRKVGYVRKYSDSLLALQLKAGNPDRYADRSKHQHTGAMLNLHVEGVVRGSTPPIDVEPEEKTE